MVRTYQPKKASEIQGARLYEENEHCQRKKGAQEKTRQGKSKTYPLTVCRARFCGRRLSCPGEGLFL